MRTPRFLTAGLAVAFVLLVYAFFGSIGSFSFHRVRWDEPAKRSAEGYYASLAEGYLRGQLHMAHRPDARLMALPHPYELEARQGLDYLWDAAYFNGRYYLYFTPLPALLFYVPVRLVSGGYPSDQLAATVFAVWAFLMAAAFARRALAGRALFLPLPLWIVTIGLANVVPFVLPYSRTYEVATFCGAAMIATWAYALLRFVEQPSTRRLVWASVWLALAIAARPNAGVLLLVFAAAIAMTRRELVKRFAIACVPLAIVAAALMAHNYARFRDPFEFGISYQLSRSPLAGRSICGVQDFAEALRLGHSALLYTCNPPLVYHVFPFIDVRGSVLDPEVSYDKVADQVAGVIPFAPLAFLGSLFAILLCCGLSGAPPPPAALRTATLLVASGWLVLLGLSSCFFVSARYEVDFWFLLAAGGAVCVEAGLAFLAGAGVRMRPLRVLLIVVAVYSIVIGTATGFRGTVGSFTYANPTMIERLGKLFP